ncbi:MAG: hypothetical protein F7B17_00120 [Desulfurococcales archaeon]|nr:hypothetical protein [Desulfurococcales archaeon]
MSEWKPPFATGKIVGSYEPLRRYLEAARRRGREDLVEAALLREEDFNLLRRLASLERVSLESLLSALEERFYDRVSGEVAREAYQSLGIRVDEESARRMMARILAGWLVESGEEWRILRLRATWEGSQS